MKWFLIYLVSLFGLWDAKDLKANTVFASAIAPPGLLLRFDGIFGVVFPTKTSGRTSSSTGGYIGGGGDSAGGGSGNGGNC